MFRNKSIGFRLNSMMAVLLLASCLVIARINAVLSRDALEKEIRERTLPAMA